MSEFSGNAIFFGAASQDIFAAPGDVSRSHMPGEKAGWVPEEHDARLESLRELLGVNDSGVEFHIGGNAMNVAARFAVIDSLSGRVGFASVLGTDEPSRVIREHMSVMGITDQTVVVADHHPSVSIVESMQGGDRMIIVRPRDPIEPHMTPAYIEEVATGAELVVATSLKSATLTQRVFQHTPRTGSFLSYNPGSTELRDHVGEISTLVQAHNPDLLAVNDAELRRITGASDGIDRIALAEDAATNYAKNVLCTLGEAGILLVQRLALGRTRLVHHPVQPLSPDKIKNTIGAGDRAHAVAALGLVTGTSAKEICEQIADETAQVIQSTGAHQDLYPLRYTNAA